MIEKTQFDVGVYPKDATENLPAYCSLSLIGFLVRMKCSIVSYWDQSMSVVVRHQQFTLNSYTTGQILTKLHRNVA